MHARIKDTEDTREKQNAEARRQGLPEPWPAAPAVTSGGYLVSALFDVGPARELPMGGFAPVLWSEILAYAQATGTVSEPWEMRAVREMSAAYVDELRRGESIFCKPPADRQSSG